MSDRKRKHGNEKAESETAPAQRKKQETDALPEEPTSDAELEFEDDFEDEFESESEQSGDDDEEAEGDAEGHDEEEDDEDEDGGPKEVWDPAKHPLQKDEVLDYDSTAYDMLHSLTLDWPCLSFDIYPDALGVARSRFPHTVHIAAGIQSSDPHDGCIMLLKMTELHKTKHDDDDDEDSLDSDLDDEAVLTSKSIKHRGAVNRLRICPQESGILATWSDIGLVHVWNTASQWAALTSDGKAKAKSDDKPAATFESHPVEGFALDWSSLTAGRLLSGDCRKEIYLWEKNEGGWNTEGRLFSGHTNSIEDLQWSPSEPEVFASCSSDRRVCIWDTRQRAKPCASVEAHDSDVNVITWNRLADNLLVSGAESGDFRIWDLRLFDKGQPAAHFQWHNTPISSVEWHPTDSSTLVVSCSDQVTVWDLAMERDTEAGPSMEAGSDGVPPQLLFVHRGQHEVKEVHWHRQINNCLVSTAADSLNIFIPSNLAPVV